MSESGRAGAVRVQLCGRFAFVVAGRDVRLWHGRPLADVTGHPWLDQQADRLADLRLVAVRAWLDARLDRGEAVRDLEAKILQQDPSL